MIASQIKVKTPGLTTGGRHFPQPVFTFAGMTREMN